jgi:hypothetical protein
VPFPFPALIANGDQQKCERHPQAEPTGAVYSLLYSVAMLTVKVILTMATIGFVYEDANGGKCVSPVVRKTRSPYSFVRWRVFWLTVPGILAARFNQPLAQIVLLYGVCR